jgi:hypothetical protein
MGRKPIWCLTGREDESFPISSHSPPRSLWKGLIEAFHKARRAFSYGERYHRIEGSAMRRSIRDGNASPGRRLIGEIDGRPDNLMIVSFARSPPSTGAKWKRPHRRVERPWLSSMTQHRSRLRFRPHFRPTLLSRTGKITAQERLQHFRPISFAILSLPNPRRDGDHLDQANGFSFANQQS